MLTKGAIGNLVNRYKAVLKKCNLINTFGSLAVASMLVLGGAGVAEAADYIDKHDVEGPAIAVLPQGTQSVSGTNTFADNTSGFVRPDEDIREIIEDLAQLEAEGSSKEDIIAAVSSPTFCSGGAIKNRGNLTLEGTNNFSNNIAGFVPEKIIDYLGQEPTMGSGGAIANAGTGNLLVKGTSTFTGNRASGYGGAIFNGYIINDNDSDAPTINFEGTATFTNNTAKEGGAIYNDRNGVINFSGTSTFSGNTANGVANDIHNLGTINFAEGSTTYLAGGISGDNTGKLTGNGSLVITDAAATISGQAEIAETLTASATGDVNDALAGDSAKLEAQLNGVKVTRMAEGLISGEVTRNADGTFTKKTSTILKDTLEQATVAPLAVNRILMNDVRKRMGDLRDASGEAGVWMRWDGGKLAGDEGLTNNFNTIQIGGDMLTGIQNVRAGVAASFTHGDVDHNNGDGEMEAYTFAAYGTWMADNGMFADVIARVGFTNSEINAKGGTADMDNEALSLSAEYGWRLPVCDQFFVEPQVELTYTHVTGADFSIKTAQYEVDSVDSLIGRAGLAAGWKLPNDRGNIYARASVVHEFLGDSKISATNKGGYAAYELDGEDTWLEYGIGANVKITDSTYIWADVERTEGAEIDEEWRGTVGIRYSF